ncbi:Fimbrial assembly family protein [Thalassoporum mexicanum PCC 7367]|uniref:PilN domain-containing protein n=1 Tax=Thalassoporum mexicanum TaxID=3457544 RepID=UPI00029FF4C4|nr:PilN domain-containing protein [Pseudanabaena sp. PCC 7367]AFY68356.1 Fimbrial assembly family protein [Pseudanabaena sp. PCC 7367]
MYDLDINFLNDREVAAEIAEQQPIEDKKLIFIGLGVGAAALAAVGMIFLVLGGRLNQLETELAALTATETQLNSQLAALSSSEQEIVAINQRTEQVVDLFVSDLPASALMQDIRRRATPLNLQLSSLVRDNLVVTISGQASTFDDVNNYVLILQDSPFLDPSGTKLVSATIGDAPASSQDVQTVPLVDYKITARITDASLLTLLPELQRAGAEGVVQRISLLKEQGVIENDS